jgi:hypothetical protein
MAVVDAKLSTAWKACVVDASIMPTWSAATPTRRPS